MLNYSKKTSGLLNVTDLHKWKYKAVYWFMFATLMCIALIALLPVVWVLLSAFKTPEEMYRIPPTFFPESFNFNNVARVWKMAKFGNAYLNSFIIVAGVMAFDIILNGMLGYVLSRIKPAGSKIVDTLIFWSMLLPGASLVPLYLTYVDLPVLHLNLTGTFIPIWAIAGANAFDVLLFRNFFNGIPMSYLEAARIDGCSDLGIFAKIILPLSVPIIMVVAIFSFTSGWSNFMWPYLILGSTPFEPVSVKLYQFSNGAGALQDNELMMVIIFAIIPVGIFYCILSKYILGGVNMSGLKG